MKSRHSMVAALVALAVVTGGVAANATSSADGAMPMAPETCVSHHPEWSHAEASAMTEAMASTDMGSMQLGGMGSMASTMGGGMSHMGRGR